MLNSRSCAKEPCCAMLLFYALILFLVLVAEKETAEAFAGRELVWIMKSAYFILLFFPKVKSVYFIRRKCLYYLGGLVDDMSIQTL